MPASTRASVTAGVAGRPVRSAVGPSAARVQSVSTAVPPLSLVTVLTRVSWAGWSSLTKCRWRCQPGRQRDACRSAHAVMATSHSIAVMV